MVVALRPETGETGVAGHTEIFQSLGEEHQKNVVRWALANRARVSEEARVALNNALIGNVSVRGFRESNVPDAPAIMLIQPVRNAALVVDAIAQSVLTVWCESRMELSGIVETAINDGDENGGSTHDASGENLSAVLASAHPQYSSDDVSLMIALMMGERSIVGEETQQEEMEQEEEPADSTMDAQRIFDDFFAELRSLPASYPEWDGPLSRLMEEIAELKANKTRELEQANGPGGRIAEVVDSHAELLSFFEWSVEEKLQNATGPWDDPESVSKAIESLAEVLERYETVREAGATYSEETRRAAERAESQEKIMEALAALEEAAVMPTPKPVIEEIVPVEDTSEEDDSETETAITGERAEITDVTNDVERQYLRELVEALQRENADLKAAQDAAHQQITELNTAAEAAEKGYQELKQEHTDLQDEAEETVRKYAEAQESIAAPPDFGDVASVLDFVENRWPNELKLALNNNSDHKLYFDQPNQVYSALEWLATTYRNSRTGEKPVANLDVSLFTTCGWRYRPFHSDTAPGKYRSDYQTTDDERKYTLDEHIGRGTGRTPGQIRVAFAWDEERQKVVVGYIGRHQRPNAT